MRIECGVKGIKREHTSELGIEISGELPWAVELIIEFSILWEISVTLA